MSPGQGNLAWADRFVAALTAVGLRDVCIGPGARSAPLALACLRRPEIVCHVINDERAAGFFALGLGKASGMPAAVLVTSGTAAANLLPAVIEANLGTVPLLVLTADRPPEAIGWGANQAASQARLYGDQLRACHAAPLPDDALISSRFLDMLAVRLIEECQAPLPGPVHANLPFREPLLPETIPAPPPLPAVPILAASSAGIPAECADLSAALSGRPGIIVCGELPRQPGLAAAIAALAARFDAPVLADPLSRLRHGTHDRSRILAHHVRFLRRADLPAPAWVLRFGTFPVSRTLEAWLAAQTQARHILVAAPGRWPDPLWRSDAVLRGDALAIAASLVPACRSASADFCSAWQAAEEKATQTVSATFFEGTAAGMLFDVLPADSHCFIGNSLAIRAVDAFAGTTGKTLILHGNRGASGIDGNLATAAGIASATASRVAALVGDQTLLHDCGSLGLMAACRGIVVLLDNGGGGIFDHLPLARTVPQDVLLRGWTAPSPADFAGLAGTFGLGYAVADSTAGLRAALTTALNSERGWLIRAVIDRQASLAAFAA